MNRAEPEEFIVEMDSPQIEIGEIEAQFDRLFGIGGIKRSSIAVSYFPLEDAVCLQYRLDFITYNQFWSRDGRTVFLNALERYNEDYEERNLSVNNRRSLQSYGTVQGYLIWQLLRYTVQAKANMNVELGYDFKERAPYFTINQREAQYINTMSRDESRTSKIIAIYFTRAQAQELAALFDPQYLRELAVSETGRSTGLRNRDVDWDEY